MTIILCISGVNANAQVTVGSDDPPHPGAVLELKTSKGLLLSKVNLANAAIFQLPGDQSKAVGMIVYNTNPNIIDGNGTGIYVWNSTKWMLVNLGISPQNILVRNITIDTLGKSTNAPNSTVQLVATVLPANATNKNLIWSVTAGSATVSSTGLLSINANATSEIVINASATDGSSVYGEYHLKVNVAPPPGISTVTGNNGTYRIYCFDPSLKLGCWMIDNSKEGTPDATLYDESPQGQSGRPYAGERGYYYTWTHANDANGTAACPAGFALPDNTLIDKLKAYIESASASMDEKSFWHSATYLAGYKHYSTGWGYWNMTGFWWSSSSYSTNQGYYYSTSYSSFTSGYNYKNGSSAILMSVRCVKPNY